MTQPDCAQGADCDQPGVPCANDSPRKHAVTSVLTMRFDTSLLDHEQVNELIAALWAQAEADERTGRPDVEVLFAVTGPPTDPAQLPFG